ncbi:hypothetical protein [Aquibacillus salsiterrae]|uniref:Uncharacterized protein n=1 Tax=Aquibacillus salsiterrae TaxID=2950439 RepID=A0A9X3WAC1_9BACI|nr:hypothetical protein [Aquibacillus salsiterrae]MDC3415370.1 hypothetical protein [Aquibacillus salsiterrae]
MGSYFFYSDYVYNHNDWTSKSIQVESCSFTNNIKGDTRVSEMDISNFWVGPGKVYVDVEQPLHNKIDLPRLSNRYIFKGCTLLLCQLPIRSKTVFQQSFSKFKQVLSDLPIDHMIVPKIPLSMISLEHIRFFGRKKVPFILLEIEDVEELKKQKWQWIQQAQSFSNIPITLNWDNIPENLHVKTEKLWNKIVKSFQINTLPDKVLTEPLSRESLRKTGISPYKGEIIPNGYADYNLFDLSKFPLIEEKANFSYHKAIPIITVMNGNVIRTKQSILVEKGEGQYRTVSLPSHFAAM